MNLTQAKIILLLSQVDKTKKNIYFLAGKLNISYSAVYNYMRILSEIGRLKKVQSGKGIFFEVASLECLEEAKEVLSGEEK